MRPDISIIIPVYNGEQYITPCLESIIKQTHSNIQIIVVDDGSKDGTVAVINEFLTDKRVVLIEQQNSGPAAARNRGFNEATGEYVWWIDADDWIEHNSVEILLKSINKSSADIIGFGSLSFDTHNDQPIKKYNSSNALIPSGFFNRSFIAQEGKDFLFDLPLEAWSRIFRRKFILEESIRFDTFLRLLDDSLFVNECFLKAESIYYVRDVLYHYREMNPNSLVNSHNYSTERYYSLPIYMASKCNDVILNLGYSLQDFQPLILRNLDRIFYLYPRIKKPFREKFFTKFKSHVKKYQLNSKEFIKESSMANTMLKIENLSYIRFKWGQFLYNKVITTKHVRITVLGLRVYKKKIN